MSDALAVTDRVSWSSLLARRAVLLCSSALRLALSSRFVASSAVQRLVSPLPPPMSASSAARLDFQTFAARLPRRYLRLDFSQEITNDDVA